MLVVVNLYYDKYKISEKQVEPSGMKLGINSKYEEMC